MITKNVTSSTTFKISNGIKSLTKPYSDDKPRHFNFNIFRAKIQKMFYPEPNLVNDLVSGSVVSVSRQQDWTPSDFTSFFVGFDLLQTSL